MCNTTVLKSLCPVMAMGLAFTASGATLTWDAGGDGVSTFQEANWTAIDGAPGTDPPADTVNPESPISLDLFVGGSATAGGTGAGGNFVLADGFSLTVQDNATFRLALTFQGGKGISNPAGGANGILNLLGSSETSGHFLELLDVSMSDAADLELNSGVDPLNNTTIDLAADWTGEIRLLNELVADTTSEHLSKITVGGDAAQVGVNVLIVSDGNTGSVLTVIPEPGSLALLGLGALCVLRRRRA
ncbi:MAG: PEP-CTERM sorting domain-containing protein [Planctomycetota bacterium]